VGGEFLITVVVCGLIAYFVSLAPQTEEWRAKMTEGNRKVVSNPIFTGALAGGTIYWVVCLVMYGFCGSLQWAFMNALTGGLAGLVVQLFIGSQKK
jgi:hypothetical protein